jgi:tRNA-(ms[2]io[6]A)-hydroxylase
MLRNSFARSINSPLDEFMSQDEATVQVLLAATPSSWFETAAQRWRELLVDHANCEKKAASTALSLIFTYAEDFALTDRLSRLAREELRHFEQVQKIMRELDVPFMRMSPSRYADGLRRAIRTREPDRLLDLLLCGALIEARSCERFQGLAPRLAAPLAKFYAGLAESEARHQQLYIRLAEPRAGREVNWQGRLRQLAEVEAELATSSDDQFRFHSGAPSAYAARS